MKEIKLTQGKVAIVDDADYAKLAGNKWCFCGRYAKRSLTKVGGRWPHVYMHRVIMGIDDDLYVDHINGDALDNRRNNLRVATNAQNQGNSKSAKGSTSIYKGVCWSKHHGKWLSQIAPSRRNIFLGLFDNEVDAAETYDVAAYHLHGEFARFNLGGR